MIRRQRQMCIRDRYYTGLVYYTGLLDIYIYYTGLVYYTDLYDERGGEWGGYVTGITVSAVFCPSFHVPGLCPEDIVVSINILWTTRPLVIKVGVVVRQLDPERHTKLLGCCP